MKKKESGGSVCLVVMAGLFGAIVTACTAAAAAAAAAATAGRLGTSRHTRGRGCDTGSHGRHAPRTSGHYAGAASCHGLALADHARALHQTRPHVVGHERSRVLAVERAAVAAVVEELRVDGERNVERVGQSAHLPGDAASLANERAYHGVAVARRQTDLWVAVQSIDNLLKKTHKFKIPQSPFLVGLVRFKNDVETKMYNTFLISKSHSKTFGYIVTLFRI
jgi:hypothetical protein